MNKLLNSNNRPTHPRTWRERMIRKLGVGVYAPVRVGDATMPSWMVGSSIVAFIIAFVVCSVAFGYVMPIEYACYSIISVLLFYLGTKYVLVSWHHVSDGKIPRLLFAWALIIRLIWVAFCYSFFNQNTYGRIDGFGDDNGWYMEFGQLIVQWFRSEPRIPFTDLLNEYHVAIDDTGYPVWLALLYVLSFDTSDVLLPLIVKAILSAYSCLCIYHVAKRHFGERTARLAGVFMCLNPYSLFWCPSMLKETEMMFLCCVCIDKTDQALNTGKGLTFMGLLPGMLAAFALFFFRTALGVVAFLAILTHIVFASRRVMQTGKKILAGLLVGLVLLVGVGDRLRVQSGRLIEQVQSGQQKSNMEWRSKRVDEGGRTQVFAKYAGAAVFAPIIFTIPFPTFNMANIAQISQAQLSGGNYIKNIFSFFVIYVLIIMFLSGEWRRHVFVLAYMLGYHIVLVMSPFAQSGRFHMPVWPMFLLFAAYGIQIANGNKNLRKGFTYVLILEVAICLAWNWFKLAGRGLV